MVGKMFESLATITKCLGALVACVISQTGVAQTVVLDPGDLVATPVPTLMIAPDLVLPEPAPDKPADDIAPGLPGADLLTRLVARGTSQGFGGLLYENRDRGHSTLQASLFPGLTFLRYDPVLRAGNWDYGLAERVAVRAPLIGNSSTALTSGPMRRSQMRWSMTKTNGPEISFYQYTSNSLYFYPEHRDNDARDLYPANWPYAVTSQGSSGSDQPFIKAALMTLAAFPKDTRAMLEKNGLIAPTLQMILRRNLTTINSDADYMTGRAHPTVFEGASLRPGRMISQAAAMTPDSVPPMVRLSVIAEDFAQKAGLGGRDERLFTTPSAIARLWRGPSWQHEMILSAESTVDPNGRALTFHWVVLRGDAGKIQIEPLTPNGSQARLRIAWHDEFTLPPVPGGESARLTSRIDIGVFADNGATLSAPAFVSVSFPTHQIRNYGPGPNDTMRLNAVDYDAVGRGAPFDPALYWTAPWRDVFDYDVDGTLLGWHRYGGAGQTAFTGAEGAAGVYRTKNDSEGRAVLSLEQTDGANPGTP